MLDGYVSGDARRVCPESPVPVIEASRRWCVPGGAANAAANVAALGGRPVLGGVIGDDYAAGELTKAAQEAGIDPSGFVKDSSRPTTAKLRVMARGQQVTRVDTESTTPLPAGIANQLAKWAEHG
jgi:D-beta-D-heptose 7-phosphate kinase/D-beta-D-heptose 1-phosphate adenosyltransferase